MNDTRPVGFVGLGNMGTAMTGRLLDAGYPVTVWARNRTKVDELVERGATLGKAPEDAIATGLLFSMLSNDDAVRDVITAERLRDAPEGFVHVNHATVSPGAATELAALAAEHGHRYLSAPVVGRPEAVAAGRLTVLASGDPGVLAEVTPMLEAMSRRVWDFGPGAASAAAVVKISVNYLLLHALQALSESITLLERHDLDADRFVEMINDSVFPGPVYGGYGRAIATGTYSPAGFTSRLGLKDLNLALDAAGAIGLDLPTGTALREVFTAAVEQVGADLDWSCVAEVTRRG